MTMNPMYKKFLALNDFIDSNYPNLSQEDYEYLVNVLQYITDEVIGKEVNILESLSLGE